MLRYLRRVDDITGGKLRWGILTNGWRWRLYDQGARSVSEQFFEIDLAAVLGVPGHDGGLFALTDENRAHWLKVFALMFRREAFVPSPADRRTFHQIALDQGRFYEERVAGDLSKLVFGFIFPTLAQSIAAAAPAALLTEVRDAALILLYRLLFILYAEDRGLLPVNDRRYDQYGLRTQLRSEVGRRKDHGDEFSPTATRYWSILDDLCRAINDGDRTIGLPPYNGGLFDTNKTALLTQVRLGDSVMAAVIDSLSFEKSETGRKYINYPRSRRPAARLDLRAAARTTGDARRRRNPGSAQYFCPQERGRLLHARRPRQSHYPRDHRSARFGQDGDLQRQGERTRN
jgi:hypothetical protein